jgi:hypothetical protein
MTGARVHLFVPGEYQDGNVLMFAFKLPEGSAAARLAKRGVSMLRLKSSRTSAARREALRRREESVSSNPSATEIPQPYEDQDAQALLDEIDAWYVGMLQGSLPLLPDGVKIGTFARKSIAIDDPIVSAGKEERVLTVIYMLLL